MTTTTARVPSMRFLQPGQRLRWSRFLGFTRQPGSAMTEAQALLLFRELRRRDKRAAKRDAWRKVLKWASDEHHRATLRHRMPARLRRHVVVESYDD